MDFLEMLKVVVLGIIQGVTEWLPVSSTGHMILFNEFFKLKLSNEFMDLFLILIQLFSILAVICVYFGKLCPIKKLNGKIKVNKSTLKLWSKIIVGCIPLVLGAFLDDVIHEKFYNFFVVSLALILYGVLFLLIEKQKSKPTIKRLDQLNYGKSFLIGFFQVLAIIPGTSRSGSTILGSLALGAERSVATEFSFFLAIPAMLGASVFKVFKYILNFGFNFSSFELSTLFIGGLVSFIVSVISIKLFMGYIKRHSFKAFGIYRIILGILISCYFFVLKPMFRG